MTFNHASGRLARQSLEHFDITQPNDKQIAALRSCITRKLTEAVTTTNSLPSEDDLDTHLLREPSMPLWIYGAEHDATVVLVNVGRSYIAGPDYVKSVVLKTNNSDFAYYLRAVRTYGEGDGKDEWSFSDVVLVSDAGEEYNLLEDQSPEDILAQFAD